MIPKIMHACWFGPNPIPEKHQKFMEHWKEVHPDWQFMLWTDENIKPYIKTDDIFVKDSMSERKYYAFFSDYARLVVLKEFGGVYFDTDVEVFKPFDDLLDCKLFVCYYSECSIGTAVIGAEKNNPIICDWVDIILDDYHKTRKFEVNNNWITKYFIDKVPNFLLTGKRQSLDGIEIYPKDYFEKHVISKNSSGGYSLHYCAASWQPRGKRNKLKHFLRVIVTFFLGEGRTQNILQRIYLNKSPYYKVYKEHLKIYKRQKH